MRPRRATALFITLAVAAGITAAFRLPWSGRNEGWRRVPEITVVSPAGDPRIPVVEEAIDFWNRSFAELGTGFRLGVIHRVNVVRNVIAHEFGHALGLGHNADPTTLMCGRPAPCRPDIYASETPHFFPLTEADRERLRRLYPPTWAP